MSKQSIYSHESIVLTTKHFKSRAIAPSFKKHIQANIKEYNFDTDSLGTFSGEVERVGGILDCAKTKCELGLKFSNLQLALASEGSFGAHPTIPFIPCDFEVLYFIDKKLDFELYVSTFSENTNFSSRSIRSYSELESFANAVKFPSHSLILRVDSRNSSNVAIKGIQKFKDLKSSYKKLIKDSKSGCLWVETDMRANQNPTRMDTIATLSSELTRRLATLCPNCSCPGWGRVGFVKGLLCRGCNLPTDRVKNVTFGCCKCNHKLLKKPAHGLSTVDPEYCKYCNP